MSPADSKYNLIKCWVRWKDQPETASFQGNFELPSLVFRPFLTGLMQRQSVVVMLKGSYLSAKTMTSGTG